LIYVAGYPAIYGKQPLYFKDPVFSGTRRDPCAQGQRPPARIHIQTEGEGITI
jgi:type IV secretion system protein VirD4